MFWHCSSCDDGGRIVKWRGCLYDQTRKSRPSADDQSNPAVELTITRDEMRALLSGGLYDFDCEKIIYTARPSKNGVLLRGRYSSMDNFEGYLAADANHEEKRARQKLVDAVQKVYDKHGLGAE